jgi:hypothetical protein
MINLVNMIILMLSSNYFFPHLDGGPPCDRSVSLIDADLEAKPASPEPAQGKDGSPAHLRCHPLLKLPSYQSPTNSKVFIKCPFRIGQDPGLRKKVCNLKRRPYSPKIRRGSNRLRAQAYGNNRELSPLFSAISSADNLFLAAVFFI